METIEGGCCPKSALLPCGKGCGVKARSFAFSGLRFLLWALGWDGSGWGRQAHGYGDFSGFDALPRFASGAEHGAV